MSSTAPELESVEIRTPWQEAWRRFKKDRIALFFLGMFSVFLLIATLAQILELTQVGKVREGGSYTYQQTLQERGKQLHDPVLSAFPESWTKPSSKHWLAWWGTTSAGKSVLLRVLYGTKVAFVVGTCGALLSVLIGMTLGLMAGYFGGIVDEIVVYLYSTLASIPYLLLMLALAFIVRQGQVRDLYDSFFLKDYVSIGLFNIIVVIGLTSWVTLCRLVRAEVKKVRELDYVHAARSLGFGSFRIMFKHVLPNVFHLVIINFSLTFVLAIKSEVILTFLGVGVAEEPSWGQMIADAKNELMRGIWWPLAFSGGFLFLLTLSINYVGDALRDALDPKLKH